MWSTRRLRLRMARIHDLSLPPPEKLSKLSIKGETSRFAGRLVDNPLDRSGRLGQRQLSTGAVEVVQAALWQGRYRFAQPQLDKLDDFCEGERDRRVETFSRRTRVTRSQTVCGDSLDVQTVPALLVAGHWNQRPARKGDDRWQACGSVHVTKTGVERRGTARTLTPSAASG